MTIIIEANLIFMIIRDVASIKKVWVANYQAALLKLPFRSRF